MKNETKNNSTRKFTFQEVEKYLSGCGESVYDWMTESTQILKLYLPEDGRCVLMGCIMTSQNTQIGDDFQIETGSDFWNMYQEDLVRNDLYICQDCFEIFPAPWSNDEGGFYCSECAEEWRKQKDEN